MFALSIMALMAITVFASLASTPAGACSQVPGTSLSELHPGTAAWDGGPSTLGVFEFQHIARSIGIIGDRSATIVTRSWGEPPASTGVTVVSAGCGRSVENSGTIGYWAATREDVYWRANSLHFEQLTNDEEQMLTERFGPPTVYEVTTTDRLSAHLRVSFPELVLVLMIAVTGAAIWWWRRPVEPARGEAVSDRLG